VTRTTDLRPVRVFSQWQRQGKQHYVHLERKLQL
jgi:hypothetical protein